MKHITIKKASRSVPLFRKAKGKRFEKVRVIGAMTFFKKGPFITFVVICAKV